MNDALQHLEEKVAYLERHVVEQDKAMLEMAEMIARIKEELNSPELRALWEEELAGMRQRITDQAPSEADASSLQDERPPHY